MTADAAALRAAFPEFKDSGRYTGAQVDFYLGLAYKLLVPARWGALLDEGALLFAAHWLALARLSATGGANGVPGTAVGVLTGGTVDKVSYTRDVQSVLEDKAGHWGMTIYGLQWLRLARMMGSGPIQVGAPSAAYGAGAWPGPFDGGVPYW